MYFERQIISSVITHVRMVLLQKAFCTLVNKIIELLFTQFLFFNQVDDEICSFFERI